MITFEQVNFSYAKPLFRGLSLRLEAGKIIGLLGRNGAGKTTLLKLVAGLLSPESGYVEVLGATPRERRPSVLGKLFFVPETAEFPAMTARQWAVACGSLYPKFSREEFFRLLEIFEVPNDKNYQTLSFGQRRKTMIGFGMATGAELLILDEPSNGLDIPAQTTLREVLKAHRSPERLVLISTHHVREFESILDDVVIVDCGQIVAHQQTNLIQEEMNTLNLESYFNRVVSGMSVSQGEVQ